MTLKPGDEGYVAPSVEELQKQIENLNKGIAGYRDEAKNAKDEAFNAKKEAGEAKAAADLAKKAIEDAAKNEEAPLNAEDQKRLESWAKSQGFVTKTELEAQSNKIFGETLKNIEDQALSEFLVKFPQFEKDDEFKKVKEQFSLYKQPTTLQGYRSVLAKVIKDLGIGAEDPAAKARAEMSSRMRLALGGGSQKEDEMDSHIEDYQKRYPKLSREQIIDRLAEINEVTTERTKRQQAKK